MESGDREEVMDNFRLAIGIILLLLSVGSFVWWMARVIQRLNQCEQNIDTLFAWRHLETKDQHNEGRGDPS